MSSYLSFSSLPLPATNKPSKPTMGNVNAWFMTTAPILIKRNCREQKPNKSASATQGNLARARRVNWRSTRLQRVSCVRFVGSLLCVSYVSLCVEGDADRLCVADAYVDDDYEGACVRPTSVHLLPVCSCRTMRRLIEHAQNKHSKTKAECFPNVWHAGEALSSDWKCAVNLEICSGAGDHGFSFLFL